MPYDTASLYLIGDFRPIVCTGNNGYQAQDQQEPHDATTNDDTATVWLSRRSVRVDRYRMRFEYACARLEMWERPIGPFPRRWRSERAAARVCEREDKWAGWIQEEWIIENIGEKESRVSQKSGSII